MLLLLPAAKLPQSCPTLCDPIDSSPPGSPVPGILQARTLEWVAISFSSAWKRKVKGKSLSRVRLFVTPWTAAYQAPPSMGLSRQEYWSWVPLPGTIWRISTLNLVWGLNGSYLEMGDYSRHCTSYTFSGITLQIPCLLWFQHPEPTSLHECLRDVEFIQLTQIGWGLAWNICLSRQSS